MTSGKAKRNNMALSSLSVSPLYNLINTAGFPRTFSFLLLFPIKLMLVVEFTAACLTELIQQFCLALEFHGSHTTYTWCFYMDCLSLNQPHCIAEGRASQTGQQIINSGLNSFIGLYLASSPSTITTLLPTEGPLKVVPSQTASSLLWSAVQVGQLICRHSLNALACNYNCF